MVRALPFPAGDWLKARGMAWDGDSLWISENSNSRTYQVDPTTGAVLTSFFGPESNQWGLAFDGTNLISAAISLSGPPPDNLQDDAYVLTTAGGVLVNWVAPDSPNANPHGCAFDPGSGSLWLSDSESDTIWEVDPADGSVLSSFASPSSDMRGLAFEGGFLWGVDHVGLSLMRFDFSGVVLSSLSIAALGSDPEGLTSDGQYLWMVENETETIFQLDVGLEIFSDGFESGDTSGWSTTLP